MPGPLWLRVLLLVFLFAAVLAGLVIFVFPWLDTFVNTNEVTVGT